MRNLRTITSSLFAASLLCVGAIQGCSDDAASGGDDTTADGGGTKTDGGGTTTDGGGTKTDGGGTVTDSGGSTGDKCQIPDGTYTVKTTTDSDAATCAPGPDFDVTLPGDAGAGDGGLPAGCTYDKDACKLTCEIDTSGFKTKVESTTTVGSTITVVSKSSTTGPDGGIVSPECTRTLTYTKK
jgi:hypothetical protein